MALQIAKASPRIIREADENDIFIRLDGKIIAKRGHRNTPQAGTWVSLEPGYTVLDSPDRRTLIVEYRGERILPG
jgi:hypothetical protein